MKVTPGPLRVIPNDKGDGYWLRMADSPKVRRGVVQGGSAVCSVWRMPPHRETAAGNAVAMAHVDELIRLLSRYRHVANKAEKAAADAEYEALKAAMLQECAALDERPKGAGE